MNGWTRLGIVASAIWMIGVGGYGHIQIAASEQQDREAAYSTHYQACYRATTEKPADAAVSARNCFEEAFQESRAPWRAQERWRAWVSAALNLLAIWIAVLTIIAVAQWVRTGFSRGARPRAEIRRRRHRRAL